MAKSKKSEYPVQDASRDLVLHITQADIKGGKRGDNDECAAAHALCRQEKFKAARIYKSVTYVRLSDGTMLRYMTPKSLYTEMMIYDRGGRFEPGDFILKAPTGVLRMGHHLKPKGKGGKTGKPPRVHHLVKKVRDNAPKGTAAYKALFE